MGKTSEKTKLSPSRKSKPKQQQQQVVPMVVSNKKKKERKNPGLLVDRFRLNHTSAKELALIYRLDFTIRCHLSFEKDGFATFLICRFCACSFTPNLRAVKDHLVSLKHKGNKERILKKATEAGIEIRDMVAALEKDDSDCNPSVEEYLEPTRSIINYDKHEFIEAEALQDETNTFQQPWNDVIKERIQKFQMNGYCDYKVTLFTQGRTLTSNALLLSAYSTYFKKFLLEKNPPISPVIVDLSKRLENEIRFLDMKRLLRMMYVEGPITTSSELDADRFASAAKALGFCPKNPGQDHEEFKEKQQPVKVKVEHGVQPENKNVVNVKEGRVKIKQEFIEGKEEYDSN